MKISNEKNLMKKNSQIILKPDSPVSKKNYHKIETKNNISITIWVWKINKCIQFIYQKNNENHMELLLLGNEDTFLHKSCLH